MCEFCERFKRNHIIDSDPFMADSFDCSYEFAKDENTPVFWIQEAREDFALDNSILMCMMTLENKENENINDRLSAYAHLKINYCPICGRKLESYG